MRNGMRLGELEGIVGEEGGLYRRSRRGYFARRTGCAVRAARAKDGRIAGRTESARIAGAGAFLAVRPRCCWTSRTNYLDLDSVHWLQDYLNSYEGVLIVISHDRHFLNSVCHTCCGHRLRIRA